MKMRKESYNLIAEVFTEHKEVIKYHKERIREKGGYQNLDVRVGFDAYHGLLSLDERRHIAEIDDLKDAHLQTAILKALRENDI